MSIVLVYNPHSGSALKLNELRKICKRHGITITAHIALSDTYKTQLKKYIKKDQVIAVIGGDGTISSVAALVAGTGAILAPLPGGTLNHFTKDLGIPQAIDEAFARLPAAKPRTIDAASVNDIVFLNNSSIGLYPSSLAAREELEGKKLAKWYAALIASIRALVKYRTYTVTIDKETFKTPFLFVGNNDYHLTDPDKARDDLTQGILSIYAVTTASRRELIGIVARALIGQLRTSSEFKVWRVSQITVHTKKPRVKVSRDGELEKLATPLKYKIMPGALRIL